SGPSASSCPSYRRYGKVLRNVSRSSTLRQRTFISKRTRPLREDGFPSRRRATVGSSALFRPTNTATGLCQYRLFGVDTRVLRDAAVTRRHNRPPAAPPDATRHPPGCSGSRTDQRRNVLRARLGASPPHHPPGSRSEEHT